MLLEVNLSCLCI